VRCISSLLWCSAFQWVQGPPGNRSLQKSLSIALRQNWRTAPSRAALRQLLRVDRLEQPSGPEVRMCRR
jgi:hypothetical protein